MTPRLPRVEDFSGRLRGPQVASRVGIWLGITMTVAFLTGLWSHVQYDTPGWLTLPSGPVWMYRVTQGLHVVAGTAAIPLLLVKLWSVFPRLFLRPPRSARLLALHGLERASIGLLVASALFQVVSGTINITQWYPWDFSFRATHYAVAWVFAGSLAVHVAVKLPIVREAITGGLSEGTERGTSEHPDEATTLEEPSGGTGLSRRALLRTTWGAAGLAVLATAGQSVPWLRSVSVFGVRSGDGPQDLPVNRSAVAAGVDRVSDDGWALQVTYAGRATRFDRRRLAAMPQATEELPIACVEGWSVSATWGGIVMADLLAAVGAPADARVVVGSMQTRGAFGSSELPAQFASDRRTLLALRLNGEELDLDHGYPCRVIAPNRPGVMQTKWVNRLEVYA